MGMMKRLTDLFMPPMPPAPRRITGVDPAEEVARVLTEAYLATSHPPAFPEGFPLATMRRGEVRITRLDALRQLMVTRDVRVAGITHVQTLWVYDADRIFGMINEDFTFAKADRVIADRAGALFDFQIKIETGEGEGGALH